MTIYTKTITAALALMLGAAPLVGTVSANAETSNGTVTFANDEGSLSINDASDIVFGPIDLGSVSNFTPTATNQGSGEVILSQSSANPSGTYGIEVKQTGAWVGGSGLAAADMPIQYDGSSITAGVAFVNDGTDVPDERGLSNIGFNHAAKNFTLDLTGSSNLTNVVNQNMTSEVTWTLTNA